MTVAAHIGEEVGDLDLLARRLNGMPVIAEFGATVEVPRRGEARVAIAEIRPVHTGGMEAAVVNGMTISGLFDAAMCAAALSRGRAAKCATMELSVKFMWPAIKAPIAAVGEVVLRRRDLVFCNASFRDGSGRLCASATGIVLLFASQGA